MNCLKMISIESILMLNFNVWMVRKRLNLAVFLLFANFLKNRSDNFFLLFFYPASWGWYWSTAKKWIWLNYWKGHVQCRKGRVWLIFPQLSILFSSIEVLPSCSFFVVKSILLQKYERCGITLKAIQKVQFGPLLSISANISELLHAMINVSKKHIYKVIYNRSVYIKTFGLRWPSKIKRVK